MAKSVKRDVTEYDDCPRRFHRRRLLAFLRRNDLPSASALSTHRARVFSDVRLLRRLVSDGRWQDARAHLSTRFLLPFPGRRRDDGDDNLETALGFIAQLHVLADLARGDLGGAAAAEDLERQVAAIPPAMAADRHYAEAVRAVFVTRCHPAFWEDHPPMDWRRVRLRASEIVGELITEAPEFRRLLRLPRRAVHPRYAIPFGLIGRRRRRQVSWKKQMMPAASLVARFFHPKQIGGSSSSESMESVEVLVDDALGDGCVRVGEHNFRSSAQGIIPAAPCVGTCCGDSSANNSAAAKRPRTTGELRTPDVVDAPLPSSSGMDPMHVFKKVNELQGVSNAMAHLVLKICAHGTPERSMFVDKVLELDKLLSVLREDSMKAAVKYCDSSGTAAAAESCASFTCT